MMVHACKTGLNQEVTWFLNLCASYYDGMSETEGGQTDEVGRRRHREQADDITTDADKQAT